MICLNILQILHMKLLVLTELLTEYKYFKNSFLMLLDH